MSKVTIVMSTYNGEKFIREQIDSILSSTFQDFELYITDDVSKDSTLSILKEYETKMPGKIHVFQNDKNLGYILNFLQAIGKTTSDYIMLCDQDDVWKSNKIEITLKRLMQMEAESGKTTPIAVFTDAVVVDQKLNVLHNSFFESGHLNPLRTDLSHILMENKLIGCTVMINSAVRTILQEQNFPAHARLHDWWIALTTAAFGKIGFISEGTLLYRQHSANIVGNTGFFTYIKNRITSLKKQKESLLALQYQAEEFIGLYSSMLTTDKRIILEQFANLHHMNFIKRRMVILKYGFFKTGLIRNIGLMFIV